VQPAAGRIGRKYLKARYVEFTDDTFTRRKVGSGAVLGTDYGAAEGLMSGAQSSFIVGCVADVHESPHASPPLNTGHPVRSDPAILVPTTAAAAHRP
jgi:hypothetical protein